MMISYGIIRYFGPIALFAAAFVQCEKIDEQMTDDEIFDVFRTTREKIPPYEIVPITHNLYKRSISNARIQFHALDTKVDSFLNPMDGVLAGWNTPVWVASSKADGTVNYKRMEESIVGKVTTYFTDNGLNTVILSVGPVGTYFEGNIDGLTFKPIPKHVENIVRIKREVQVLQNTSRTLATTGYHAIYKSNYGLPERKVEKLSRFFNETDGPRAKRTTQGIIFPSLLVTTNYKTSPTRKEDFAYRNEIIYQLAFWNAVDLRYRHLKDPKVRLRIAGIIIGIDRGATPYMNNNKVNEEIDVGDALNAMKRYWHSMLKHPDFPLQAYDIIATLTDYSMFTKNDQGRKSSVIGRAGVEALCVPPVDKFYATAIIKDNGAFGGTVTAAHELGHIMGAGHDGTTGDQCDKSYGFIMQPSDEITDRNLEWSPCSLKAISYFLREPDVTCADTPSEFHPPGTPAYRFLPGDILDDHKQCQARGFDSACDPTPEMCIKMRCHYSVWKLYVVGSWCRDTGPAAEGTVCGPDRRCVDGKCQKWLKNN